MADIQNLNESWNGHSGDEVQRFARGKMSEHDARLSEHDVRLSELDAGKISGVVVNNEEARVDASGKALIDVPTVSSDVSNPSNPNAAQAGAVAAELNAVKGSLIYGARRGAVSADGSEVALEFLDSENDVAFSVNIPAAQDVGEVIYPVIIATRLSSSRMKLGDNVRMSWQYDCLSNQQQGSMTEYRGTVRMKVQLTNDSGTTTLKNMLLGTGVVAGSTAQTVNIDGGEIPSSGTLRIVFTAVAEIDGEMKSVQRSVTVTVVSLSLSSNFDPSIGLATNGGYISGDTITIPYAYSVPVGTTLKAWLNGSPTPFHTAQISGTSSSRLTGISIDDLQTGRNNVQMIAIDEQGLLSNVVSIDLRKSGDTSDFLGFVMEVSSDGIDNVSTDMPMAHAYGSAAMSVGVNQFSSLELAFAVWNHALTWSEVTIAVDGIVVQTLTVGRTRQMLTQRFDDPGRHVMTVSMGTCVWSVVVDVLSVGSITEGVAGGYVKQLSAVGRNNSLADREEWGDVTTLTGLNFSSNGWMDDALLLTNGAKAYIDLKPFADYSGDGNGIHQMGVSVEVELMVSQVVERGAAILHCLWDNVLHKSFDPTDASSYPRGIKVATDKASLLFGGVEEIHTTEKVQDADGNYLSFAPVSPAPAVGTDISSAGYYVKESTNVYRLTADTMAKSGTTYYSGTITSKNSAQDLYVIRPYGAEMNIAENKWMHLAFVIQPVTGTTYLLGMLYINGVLSRVNRFANDAITALDMRQETPLGITIDSDKADVKVRTFRYYRAALDRDQILSNYIATLHTASEMQVVHDRNDVAGVDVNNHATISRSTLIETKKRGVLTIVKSRKKLSDTENRDLNELFENGVGKKEDFCADYIRWDPPCDANGDKIGEGFEVRNVNIRIQGTSSVNYPYKNIRMYLAKTSFHSTATPASITVGSKTYNYDQTSKKMIYDDGTENGEQFKGYALRGSGNSMVQAVLCAKTDFVDSSLVMNTGGAHLFNDKMKALGLVTPPMLHDARVRQAIDGIPCDLYAGTSESGPFFYFGQFVLNNEKSKSDKIFGMSGVSGFTPACPIALEALENRYALTLFQSAGMSSSALEIGGTTTSFDGTSEENAALETLLTTTFGKAFEFNYPEDVFWTQAEVNEQEKPQDCRVATELEKNAIRRLMSFIYRSVKESGVTMSHPEYGDQNGWSAADRQKWHSGYFREHVSDYFDVDYLCTYYLFTDYWASVDQRAKNILWRTWDGLKWYPTYYDGDTAMSIRNDAFMVYLYSVTRDTYDNERSKFAFEGHDSWLWCLLLANVEYGNADNNPIYNRLAACARAFRNQVSLDAMLTEFNENMMWKAWSERQYNYSQKLKYIDTMDVKYYPYTLTGNREAHRTQFLTERSALLDAQYTAGDYLNDTFTISADRSSSDSVDTLSITSGDLYYFGFRDVQNNWVMMPQRAEAGRVIDIVITQELNATSGQSNVTGASKIRELDLTGMTGHINSVGMNLSKCVILEKLVINSRTVNGTTLSFGGTIALGNTTKLRHIDLSGQNGVNTGQSGRFDLSKHSRLGTVMLSGTGLTTLLLPEGAPITTLALPNTLGVLTLRNLPLLTMGNLTMESDTWTGVLGLNFANCPKLSWTTLLERCSHARRVRIEGMSGRIRSSVITPFIEGWNPNNPTDSSNLVYHGLNADGTNNNWPQFGGGVVMMIDYLDKVTVGGTEYTFEQLKSFFEKCELTVNNAQYSEYIFHDEETDPCNISNEDNQTGYSYHAGASGAVRHDLDGGTVSLPEGHPLGYAHSGHVDLIHDRCAPVVGYIDGLSHKMKVIKLPTGSWGSTDIVALDGGGTVNLNDPNGEGYDIFLYVPRYFYKGVNDYKNARKHLFLSGLMREPISTATEARRYALSDLIYLEGKAVDKRYQSVGDSFSNASLSQASELTLFRVDVAGMKQVRFPGHQHSNFCSAFVDESGKVVSLHNFQMEDVVVNGDVVNPSDFDNTIGDYIFLPVPDGARYLYFQCGTSLISMFAQGKAQGAMPITNESGVVTGYAAVLLTDSSETEAIEPDWVEHQPELIGIYSGSCHIQNTHGDRVYVSTTGKAVSGLRSISGVTIQRGSGTYVPSPDWTYDSDGNPDGHLPSTYTVNGTAQDFFNLARIRTVLEGVVGGKYTVVPYETSKDMANLFMVWFGTRDIESIVGVGSSVNITTGIRNQVGGIGDSYKTGCNKVWGIEAWTGTVYEWMDNVCMNAPSFARFLKDHRPDDSAVIIPGDYAVDNYYNILQQDGKERRVKAAKTGQGTCVARVRFGRYCDIVVSSYTGETTYAMGYSAYQSTNNTKSRVLGRSHYNSNMRAGVANLSTGFASSMSTTYSGGRLCFFGEIENENEENLLRQA